MTCQQIRPELDAYRTGEVAPDEALTIELHLDQCADCRSELTGVRQLATALRDLPRLHREAAGERSAAGRPAPAVTYYSAVESPAGALLVGYRGRRLVAVGLQAGEPHGFAERLDHRFGPDVRASDAPPAWVMRAVRDAFAGRRARYLPIDLSDLGPFDRAVLEKAREIPPGEVRTYAWIAREIGRPGAVRAVGTALGQNPVPFLIPCHRVVRSDLSLGGYAFRPDLKRQLLEAEGVPLSRLTEWSARGYRLAGSRTTRIFCFPSCSTGRRMKESNLVPFRSLAEAQASGYRPCKVCRPAPAEAS